MLIQWTPDLTVGINAIDDQHRELFAKIDEMLAACNAGKGRQQVGELLKFLEDYVVTHFKTEEIFMVKFEYPEYREHQAHHAQFIAKLAELKEKFQTDGPGIHIVIMLNHVVVQWLNAHIRNVDKRLGAFLKGKV